MAGGIVLFVRAEWAWGVVAFLGAAVVLLATRAEKRRGARYALGGLAARFSASRESIAARSRGQIELFRARRERAELEAEKTRALQAFGGAVFHEDEEGTKTARAAVQAVVDRIDANEADIRALIARTEERIQRAQAGVRATEGLEPPPGPAKIPEPSPPADEGEPPGPATVPEPGPDEPAREPKPASTPRRKAKVESKKPRKTQKT